MDNLLLSFIGIQFCLFIIVVTAFYIKFRWVLIKLREIAGLLDLADVNFEEFSNVNVQLQLRVADLELAVDDE